MTWVRPTERCDDGFTSILFDAFYVINDGDEAVIVDIDVSFAGDGYLHLMDETFDPDSPADSCLFGDDDTGGFTTSALHGMTIPAGAVRVIAVSSFSSRPIGSYSGTIVAR